MFLVSDTREKRAEMIRRLMKEDVAMAVVIATADFEWTIRRCILALGKSTTKDIREKLKRREYRSFGGYPALWRVEVDDNLGKILRDFKFGGENKAFNLRNRIIHGEIGTVGLEYGIERVKELLEASKRLTDFAGEAVIYSRIDRRKPRVD